MDIKSEKIYDIKSEKVLYVEDFIDNTNFCNQKTLALLVKILAEKDILSKEDLVSLDCKSNN